jgi:hypothetical protein
MTDRRLKRLARGILATLTTAGAVLMPATAASAEPPARVGWWNAVSAGGTAAPAPTTPNGGMRVAATSGRVLAYGAVLYRLPEDALLGRLTLSVADSQGTVQLLACPTKTTTWRGGDDQPASSAPAYDCGTTKAIGTVSPDGKTVSFALTTLSGRALSLAIVPDLSEDQAPVSRPFSVDLDKPTLSSLQVTVALSPRAVAPRPPRSTAQPPPTATHEATIAAGRPLGLPDSTPSTASRTRASERVTAPHVAPGAVPTTANATQPATASGRSAQATIGGAVGVLALVVAFMFWGLGRGLFGGRILPLSIPTRSAEP